MSEIDQPRLTDIVPDPDFVTVVVDRPHTALAEVYVIDVSKDSGAERVHELNRNCSDALVFAMYGLRAVID